MLLPMSTTVAEFRQRLANDYPTIAPIVAHLFVAINGDYADDQALIHGTDEVACFPPVSGG